MYNLALRPLKQKCTSPVLPAQFLQERYRTIRFLGAADVDGHVAVTPGRLLSVDPAVAGALIHDGTGRASDGAAVVFESAKQVLSS